MTPRPCVVSCPDLEMASPQHDHLWVIIGGGDYNNGGHAYYLNQDRDIEGDDLAGREIGKVVEQAEHDRCPVDRLDIENALADYREKRNRSKLR